MLQAVGILSKLVKPDFADVDPKAAAAAAHAAGAAAAAAAATAIALSAPAPHPQGYPQQVTSHAVPEAQLLHTRP